MVTLYAGGMYNLYTYKKYTDIRIVFAPEKQIAFYGGDPDNFEYPRYDLDICFFRVYENGKPINSENYLRWSPHGSKDDELVFVSGHPGRTNRGDTIDELKYLRNTGYPYLLNRLNRLEVLLGSWGGRSERNMQRARRGIVQHSEQPQGSHRRSGRTHGPGPHRPQRETAGTPQEQFLTSSVSKQNEEALKAFGDHRTAEKVRAEIIKPMTMLESGGGLQL